MRREQANITYRAKARRRIAALMVRHTNALQVGGPLVASSLEHFSTNIQSHETVAVKLYPTLQHIGLGTQDQVLVRCSPTEFAPAPRQVQDYLYH